MNILEMTADHYFGEEGAKYREWAQENISSTLLKGFESALEDERQGKKLNRTKHSQKLNALRTIQRGFSSVEIPSTITGAQQILTEQRKLNLSTIPVYNPQRGYRHVPTTRHVFTPDESRKLRRFAKNSRLQSALTETSLSDILESIKEGGQRVPAYGRWISIDGGERVIEVIAGTRRLAATILAGREYIIDVLDDSITDDEAEHLARAENEERREESAWEKGRACMRIQANSLAKEKRVTSSELAMQYGVSRKTINQWLSVARLDESVIGLYPVPNCVGAEIAAKLLKVVPQLLKQRTKELQSDQQSCYSSKTCDLYDRWQSKPDTGQGNAGDAIPWTEVERMIATDVTNYLLYGAEGPKPPSKTESRTWCDGLVTAIAAPKMLTLKTKKTLTEEQLEKLKNALEDILVG